jgi:aminomethyltransferase
MVNGAKGHYRAKDLLVNAKKAGPTTQLAGLKIAGTEAPVDGDRVVIDGRDVGFITSATLSPQFGHALAIAFLETPAAAHGTAVEVLAGENRLSGTVSPMPFFDPERKLSKA